MPLPAPIPWRSRARRRPSAEASRPRSRQHLLDGLHHERARCRAQPRDARITAMIAVDAARCTCRLDPPRRRHRRRPGHGRGADAHRSTRRQRVELGGVGVFLCAMLSDTFVPGQHRRPELRGTGGVGTGRRLVKAGALEVIPCHVSQIDDFIADGTIACDVALVQVAPPRRSTAATAWASAPTTRAPRSTKARVVIAEMNHACRRRRATSR